MPSNMWMGKMKNAKKLLSLTTLFLMAGAAALTGCAKAQTGSTCGDGIRQLYEECEGTNLAGQSCASLGLGAGTLACSSDCTFDTHACSAQGRCGDGIRQSGEQCDDGEDNGPDGACSENCQFNENFTGNARRVYMRGTIPAGTVAISCKACC